MSKLQIYVRPNKLLSTSLLHYTIFGLLSVWLYRLVISSLSLFNLFIFIASLLNFIFKFAMIYFTQFLKKSVWLYTILTAFLSTMIVITFSSFEFISLYNNSFLLYTLSTLYNVFAHYHYPLWRRKLGTSVLSLRGKIVLLCVVLST